MTSRTSRCAHAPAKDQGVLEVNVLAVLGGAPGPVTAGWVREQIDPALACTTVVTTLTRLLGKRAVVRHRDGRSYVWRALFDGAGLAARRMHHVLDKENDRGAVLSHFVAGLPPDDERSLRLRLGSTTNAGADMGTASRWDPPCPGVPVGRLLDVDVAETALGGRATGSVR
ncbi:BlaI/MecI/CopY family transcriptional regulator [Streptomyces sp. DH24]|uniref:BlaI/MecI/CopY family transcriptional regulator n=1 Tax=Streptomyces sp. DH24 TaxID=3040123 RepID=UPI0024411DD4|nr:BlaI/MecI/CopY family transcriptional regulator [Streptomyces sp. DH24]MDG9720146.1 BlaI/MecI/CopY family transcriptional regulator [Streptomyces sp. DH24]